MSSSSNDSLLKRLVYSLFVLLNYPSVAFCAHKVIPTVEAVSNGTGGAVGTAQAAASAVGTATAAIATGTPSLVSYFSQHYDTLLASLGVGGIMGWAVGYTFKKAAKILAIVFGVTFIAIQFLSYNQFITINWDKIKTSLGAGMNTSGYWETISTILTYNLPFAGSFVAGFWIGFKQG